MAGVEEVKVMTGMKVMKNDVRKESITTKCLLQKVTFNLQG
jgi:hypothetical protein